MDIRSWFKKKRNKEEIQSLSSEYSPGAIALGETLRRFQDSGYQAAMRNALNGGGLTPHLQLQAAFGSKNSFGGYNVPLPLTPDDPASFFPEISKDPNKTILVARFNDGLLVIFTCQSCGLQQMKEIESISGDKKEVTDAIFAWVHSLTDDFPKCSSVCEVLEAIAK